MVRWEMVRELVEIKHWRARSRILPNCTWLMYVGLENVQSMCPLFTDNQSVVSVTNKQSSKASKLVSGSVKIDIKSTLLVKGISLPLGNDLAGNRVVTDPILMDKPCLDQSPDPIEEAIP